MIHLIFSASDNPDHPKSSHQYQPSFSLPSASTGTVKVQIETATRNQQSLIIVTIPERLIHVLYHSTRTNEPKPPPVTSAKINRVPREVYLGSERADATIS
ncbi:hypothetical protein GWI33_003215 [Rhynchophorus ferrugineus]|uniref:Uncharacterized protein n=1 Tax=Rhynchophorus ferrugineus TaxID=354439 RepID=A0A834MN34_RHYFE|nr:hypothetical protein GWI33_003215 [Rhynchophorus ferrugineus]